VTICSVQPTHPWQCVGRICHIRRNFDGECSRQPAADKKTAARLIIRHSVQPPRSSLRPSARVGPDCRTETHPCSPSEDRSRIGESSVEEDDIGLRNSEAHARQLIEAFLQRGACCRSNGDTPHRYIREHGSKVGVWPQAMQVHELLLNRGSIGTTRFATTSSAAGRSESRSIVRYRSETS
jgi:hypothetical protein